MARPLKFKNAQELENAILAYFEDRQEKIKPPTVSGLALHLGFESRQSIYDYKEREEFSYIIKRAILFIEDYAETQLLSGEVATGAIFWLKNHRWIDKTEQDHNIRDYSLFEKSVEEKAKKYDNKRGNKAKAKK